MELAFGYRTMQSTSRRHGGWELIETVPDVSHVVTHKDDLDPVSVASGLEDSKTAPTI